MSAVITAAGTMFAAIFGATGWVSQVITLITANDFLLIGLSLLLTGSAVSYLSKVIRG